MKVSLDTRFADAAVPNIYPAQWQVTETALLTASAVATRVSGKLAAKFVDEHVEVLRFRFRKQREDRTTLFKFATVITFGGQKFDREIEASLEMPETSYSDKVNYGTVINLTDSITAFVCEEIGKIVDSQRKGLESIQRRLVSTQ